MKTITIKTDCFPVLLESGFLPATQRSFGRAMKDLFFNRFAEVVISNTNPHSNIDHTLKHIPKERIAIDFFKWDYQLDVYRYADKYEAYLSSRQGYNQMRWYGLLPVVGSTRSDPDKQPLPEYVPVKAGTRPWIPNHIQLEQCHAGV